MKPKFLLLGYGEYMLNGAFLASRKIGDRWRHQDKAAGMTIQIPESLADEIAQAFRNVERPWRLLVRVGDMLSTLILTMLEVSSGG